MIICYVPTLLTTLVYLVRIQVQNETAKISFSLSFLCLPIPMRDCFAYVDAVQCQDQEKYYYLYFFSLCGSYMCGLCYPEWVGVVENVSNSKSLVIFSLLAPCYNAGLWIRIRINLCCWIRIRIQEGKNDVHI